MEKPDRVEHPEKQEKPKKAPASATEPPKEAAPLGGPPTLPGDTPKAPARKRTRKTQPLVSVASLDASRDATEATGTFVSTIDAVSEARVISTVLVHPKALDDLDMLKPEHFGVPAHAILWTAILACDGTARPIDAVTVADEVTRSGQLNAVGGPPGIDRVLSAQPVIDEVDVYAQIIVDRALRRNLAAAAHRIASAATSGTGQSEDLAALATEEIFKATSTTGPSTSVYTMPQMVAALHARMATSRSSRLVGQPTGFDTLDQYTAGWSGGQLIVIGARPAMGKSVMLLQMARTLAEATDMTVPFFSYEMNLEEIGFRLLASSTGIPMSELMRGWVPDGMDKVLARQAEKLAELRLIVDDSPPPTVSALRSTMRRMARHSPIGGVVVDYMQLMHGDARRHENRNQEVSEISRELKLMAKELNVPVLAASQLNRQVESRTGNARRPQLSDLRESGSVEQDANVVLFIHRESVYNPTVPADEAELIVGKNRQGPSGVTIPLKWEGPLVRFTERPATSVGSNLDSYF